jgi:cell division protein FtsB
MNTYYFHAATLAALGFTILQLSVLGKAIMSTQDKVDALTAQVSKVYTEVQAAKEELVAQVAALEEQLANAGVAEQIDLTALSDAVQVLDDINPDADTPEA